MLQEVSDQVLMEVNKFVSSKNCLILDKTAMEDEFDTKKFENMFFCCKPDLIFVLKDT